jgi:hypothetical protein
MLTFTDKLTTDDLVKSPKKHPYSVVPDGDVFLASPSSVFCEFVAKLLL